MCYEYSFRKERVKAQMENRRQEASFWSRVNAWIRDARSLSAAGEAGTPAGVRRRKGEKVTG